MTHPGQHGQGTGPPHTLILGHHSTRLRGSSEDWKEFSVQAGGPGSGEAPHADEERHA